MHQVHCQFHVRFWQPLGPFLSLISCREQELTVISAAYSKNKAMPLAGILEVEVQKKGFNSTRTVRLQELF